MTAPDPLSSLTQVSRRDFLAVGGAGVVGLSLRSALAAKSGNSAAVIQIVMNGGASQLETFDPKPHAPREIRGPLHSIATRIPSVRFSECLPRLASRADRLVVIRSLHHDAAPIHESGMQLLRSGQLTRPRQTATPIGVTLRDRLQGHRLMPASIEIDRQDVIAGMPPVTSPQMANLAELKLYNQIIPNFQQAPVRVREAYGTSDFAQRLWTAVRLVERGTKYVLVNMFDQIEGKSTWDAHADPVIAPATLFDYRDSLGPIFDQALSALLDELQQTGLWKQMLVICAGEMGRAPHLNENGGRDHWTQAWSGILAGGMLEGGQVIGETDEHAETILKDPLPVSQLPFMAQEFLGVPVVNEGVPLPVV